MAGRISSDTIPASTTKAGVNQHVGRLTCSHGSFSTPFSISTAARWTSRQCGRASTFAVACALIVCLGGDRAVLQFSDTWQLVINTGTTIVTFLMVFLIQNTQNRDSAALHLKLDELIWPMKPPATNYSIWKMSPVLLHRFPGTQPASDRIIGGRNGALRHDRYVLNILARMRSRSS